VAKSSRVYGSPGRDPDFETSGIKQRNCELWGGVEIRPGQEFQGGGDATAEIPLDLPGSSRPALCACTLSFRIIRTADKTGARNEMCTRRPLSRAGATKCKERLSGEECVNSVPSGRRRAGALFHLDPGVVFSLPLKRSKSGSSRLWPPNQKLPWIGRKLELSLPLQL
jgi:hypothetical protein